MMNNISSNSKNNSQIVQSSAPQSQRRSLIDGLPDKSIFQYAPKAEYEQEIESYMPLYLDIDYVDPQYLSNCYEKLRTKQIKSSQNNDNEALTFIQERLKVLVFQNPMPNVSEMFSPLLLEENQEEPRISKYFMNDDFPSIIKLQRILFPSQNNENESSEQVLAKSIKRISDQSAGSNGDCDFSTIDSGIESSSGKPIEILEKEALHKQKVYSTETTTAEDLRVLLTRIFNAFNGRIPNIFRPFLFFPEYLNSFFQSFEETFLEPCAWPFQQLYQIALMTASAYESSYVFFMFGELYQTYSGSTDYLIHGFDSLEPKVKKAWDLILFLKNNPSAQILNPTTINQLFYSLIRTGPAWSQSELVCAILAISLAQQLSTLSHSLGLIEETDSRSSSIKSSKKTSETSTFNHMKMSEQMTNDVIKILNDIKLLELKKEDSDQVEDMESPEKEQNEFSLFEDENISSIRFGKYIGLPQESYLSTGTSTVLNSKGMTSSCSCVHSHGTAVLHTLPSCDIFQSPDKGSSKNKKREKLKLSDLTFNWSTHAVEFIASRNKELSKTLNNKYKQVQKMTLSSFGAAQSVDTGIFREAIWNYCEIATGFTKIDYDYKKMNSLLSKPFRAFLSKILLKPQHFHIADIDHLPYLFQPQDIIHTYFLATEAKFYTQINSFFYSLQQFLK